MDEARTVFRQIQQMTLEMIETPLVEDQNQVVKKGKNWNDCEIDVAKNSNNSFALKRNPYKELYYEMSDNRSYNLKLIDGALVLLQYKFENSHLTKHRLGYYPNPDLAEFQENHKEFMEDALFFECIDPRNVVIPFRFDYDGRGNVVKELEHPESHLTLGQYHDCRIPVSRPLMPAHFIDFIVRNFYHLALKDYEANVHRFFDYFPETIRTCELGILHMAISECLQ